MAGLTVLIPTLNEASNLPLLMADLRRWPHPLQLLVVDAGSQDATRTGARLAGADVSISRERGRGQQLVLGMAQAQHDWRLVLHADSRLPPHWPDAVFAVQKRTNSSEDGWYFDLRIDGDRAMLRLLERCVALRSSPGQRPYGDQGLLIHRRLEAETGGYRPLPLMEDLELVQRITAIRRMRRIGCPITTSGRRWQTRGVLEQAWRNARLRRAWARGEAVEQLVERYNS